MLLASSPSRVDGSRSRLQRRHRRACVDAEPGTECHRLLVNWDPAAVEAVRVAEPSARVMGSRRAPIAVKAVNAKGLEGWDWATTVVR